MGLDGILGILNVLWSDFQGVIVDFERLDFGDFGISRWPEQSFGLACKT
jgi:hypothetical protein